MFTYSMIDVEGHLVESLFVCNNSPNTGSILQQPEQRRVCLVTPLKRIVQALLSRRQGFPAETTRHPQEGLWNKKSSLSAAGSFATSVHFLQVISSD